MADEFFTEPNPGTELCEELVALAPTNPFCMAAYAAAKREMGLAPWAVGLRRDGRIRLGCLAFVASGRLNRTLEIISVPAAEDEAAFWEGLAAFCRREGISRLEVNSFGSSEAKIPRLRGETSRRPRIEYVLDLRPDNPWTKLGSNHKRNIKNARKAGVQVRRATDEAACAAHVRLVSASLQRREERGETVVGQAQLKTCRSFTRTGAGALFQAVREGEVLSSMLVLLGRRGAYYQSAGTSPAGMDCGASHLLVHETANLLRAEGFEVFNLGGADPRSGGLNRFKSDFGASKVALEAAEFFLGSRLRKKVTGLALRLYTERWRFVKGLFVHVQRFYVYSADPHEVAPPEPIEGTTVAKLSDDDLRRYADEFPELHQHVERVEKFGFNGAYGAFCEGRLAAIVWMITAENDARCKVRNVKLRPGEVELTHGVTLPEFRGRGLYTYLIRHLTQQLPGMGVRRVFGMTNFTNTIAQKGIEKAGLKGCGKIIRVVFPLLPGGPAITYREHRWRPPRDGAAGARA